jgi:hypothetical protein
MLNSGCHNEFALANLEAEPLDEVPPTKILLDLALSLLIEHRRLIWERDTRIAALESGLKSVMTHWQPADWDAALQ